MSSARPRRTVLAAAAVLPGNDTRLAALPAAQPVSGAVVLKPRDEAALTHFIARVTTPGSPAFHDYLRQNEFAARFGPTPAARARVIAALRADGLRVGAVSSDGLIVPFSAPARTAERAFATEIDAVRLSGGQAGRATSEPVSLPSTIAGSVTAVLGLDETAVAHRIGAATVPVRPRRRGRERRGHPGLAAAISTPASAAGTASTAPTACPDATAAAATAGGLTDTAIADAYGAQDLYAAGDDGAGQHIALYENEPFLRSDVRTFDSCYFGAAKAAAMMRRLHVVAVDGGQPVGPGSGEASLDVEDLSALASGADIDVYVGPSDNPNPTDYDAFDEYAAIVDADRDQVVSSSWGLCEQSLQLGQPGQQQAENLIFQQAAAQGQTVFGPAGDSGSDDCDTAGGATPSPGQNPLSVDDPGSQPYVVSVGGLAIDDATADPPLEHVWNDGGRGGAGGGGISESWTMPAWQQQSRVPGIVRPGSATYAAADRVERAHGYAPGFCNAHAPAATALTPCRLVPDVSAQADEYTGAVTVYSASVISKQYPTGWSTTGGTSSATPIWAAMLALVNASPACRAHAQTRDGVGFASPLLYAVASDPARYAASFDDVRAGNNDVYGLGDGATFAATPGYDPASGLGSPRLTGPGGTAGLAVDLCDAAASPARPTVTGVLPADGAVTGGERVKITGAGFTAHGKSAVAAVQVGDRRLGTASVHASGPHVLVVTIPPAAQSKPPRATAGQDGAGTAAVVVTLRDGAASAPSPNARFTYLDEHAGRLAPTVTTLSPTGGPERGGAAVTILGAGFHRGATVTFGGVRAERARVDSANRITVVPPAHSAKTRCAPLPRTGVYADENAGNDICQVQVRVTSGGAISPAVAIRAPFEGAVAVDALGDVVTPAGCHCEQAPAADEFDYLPRPRITSVSTARGPTALASERGTTVVTVHGSGFDPLALDWADVGAPGLWSSVDENDVYLSGTEMQITAPAQVLTAGELHIPLSVRTLAGQSAARTLTYAGVPVIMRVVNRADARNLDGLYGGPDTGRTPLQIEGRGLGAQVIGLRFAGRSAAENTAGTQYTWHSRGTGRLLARTVAENPGVVAVHPCTVTGCTPAGAHNLFWLYPPGAPRVSAIAPATGPAAGGTVVAISGQNLGCALGVRFGAAAASAVTPSPNTLGCDSTEALTATAPAGAAGTSAPVTVQTAESFYTGAAGSSAAAFAYR